MSTADLAFYAEFAWRLLVTIWLTVATVYFWRDRRNHADRK